MEQESVSYPEAPQDGGQTLRNRGPRGGLSEEEARRNDDRESMFAVNSWAADYFANFLHRDSEGMNVGLSYFRQKRGLTDATIKKFGLGFCPRKGRPHVEGCPRRRATSRSSSSRRALAGARSDGSLYDRFRDRVIFPVHNISGRIVAFGGHALRTGQDRSLNTRIRPERDLQQEARTLRPLLRQEGHPASQISPSWSRGIST